MRQALGHAGESRPGWWVLEELCERLGAGTGALSAAAVTALVAEAVPFYADITLDEIGGEGVRWQDREAAQAAPSDDLPTDRLEQPPAAPEGMVLGAAPSLWTGPGGRVLAVAALPRHRPARARLPGRRRASSA